VVTVKFIYYKNLDILMETVTIPREEYSTLKKKAEASDDLLIKLVKSLENIRLGKIKPWTRKTKKVSS